MFLSTKWRFRWKVSKSIFTEIIYRNFRWFDKKPTATFVHRRYFYRNFSKIFTVNVLEKQRVYPISPEITIFTTFSSSVLPNGYSGWIYNKFWRFQVPKSAMPKRHQIFTEIRLFTLNFRWFSDKCSAVMEAFHPRSQQGY